MMEPSTHALNPFQPDAESFMWADVAIGPAHWVWRVTWPMVWWSARDEQQMVLLSLTLYLRTHADPPSQIHYVRGSESSPSFIEYAYESDSTVLAVHETDAAISEDSPEH
jgi:hypothetical protein